MYFMAAPAGCAGEKERIMGSEPMNLFDDETYYTLVPEQGLCLIGDDILNLKRISLIRKAGGKTLVYCPGVGEPVVLPEKAFDRIRDAVFTADDLEDEEDFDDEDEG